MNVLNKVSIQCSLNKYLSTNSCVRQCSKQEKDWPKFLPWWRSGQRTYTVSVCAVFFITKTKLKRGTGRWEQKTPDERGPSCPRGLRVSPSQIWPCRRISKGAVRSTVSVRERQREPERATEREYFYLCTHFIKIKFINLEKKRRDRLPNLTRDGSEFSRREVQESIFSKNLPKRSWYASAQSGSQTYV